MNVPRVPRWGKAPGLLLLLGGLTAATALAALRDAFTASEPVQVPPTSERQQRGPSAQDPRPSTYKPYRLDHDDERSLNAHFDELKSDLQAASNDRRQIVLVIERAGEAGDSAETFLRSYRAPTYRDAWQKNIRQGERDLRYVLLHGGLTPDGNPAQLSPAAFHEGLIRVLNWSRAAGQQLEVEFELPPIESIPDGIFFEECWGRSLEAFLSGQPEAALRWMRESVQHDLNQIRLRDQTYALQIQGLLAAPGRFVVDLRGGFHDAIVTGERRRVLDEEVRRQVEESIPILRYHLRLVRGDLTEAQGRELLKLSVLQALLEDLFTTQRRVSEERVSAVTTRLAERLQLTDEEFRAFSRAMGEVHTQTPRVKPEPFDGWLRSHPRIGPLYRRGTQVEH
jgi:hypothetical protein